MSYEGLLRHSMYLENKYSSQNSLGEWTYTYSSSSSPTECRMSPLSASERLDQTGRFDDVKYKCFCLSSSSITRNNRLSWNDEYYRIKEVILDSQGHHKTAYLIQVT